jgi:hypothetical protein
MYLLLILFLLARRRQQVLCLGLERGLKPLPNDLLVIIIKINLTTNYQLLLNCNKVHRATPTLKWPLRIGAPRSTSDNSTFSDNDGSNPNANDTSIFFTIKHYRWLLQYQQLFQFYLVHGHTNVTRRNADNSLAEWASYQRSKMVATDKYDVKWKHLLNGIGFCSTPPPTPNQVFEKHMLA